MFGFFKTQDINKGVEDFKATEGAILIDARTRNEYQSGHIPGSINIDAGEIDKAATRIPNKETPLFVYCLSGSRSSMATKVLKSMGYVDVENIGGINSYSGPIEKGN